MSLHRVRTSNISAKMARPNFPNILKDYLVEAQPAQKPIPTNKEFKDLPCYDNDTLRIRNCYIKTDSGSSIKLDKLTDKKLTEKKKNIEITFKSSREINYE